MRSAPLFLIPFVALAFAGCPAPSMQLTDQLAPPGDDGLHAYASHAKVPFLASWKDVPFTSDGSKSGLTVKATGAVSFDPDGALHAVPFGVEGPAAFAFGLVTGDAGAGTVTITDDQVGLSQTFTLNVVDVDALTNVESAEVAQDGIDVPAVDASGVRIFQGGHAAFRVEMSAKGAPVFGLGAVTAASPDANVVGTAGSCIAASNDSFKSAVDVAVLPNASAPVDVTLSAGSAQTVLHVIPTTAADVTSMTAQSAKSPQSSGIVPFHAPAVPPNPAVVVARVLAGASPVFGAPVAWSSDSGEVKGQGDALVTSDFSQGGGTGAQAPLPTPNLTATLGNATTTAEPTGLAEAPAFTAVDAAGPFVAK